MLRVLEVLGLDADFLGGGLKGGLIDRCYFGVNVLIEGDGWFGLFDGDQFFLLLLYFLPLPLFFLLPLVLHFHLSLESLLLFSLDLVVRSLCHAGEELCDFPPDRELRLPLGNHILPELLHIARYDFELSVFEETHELQAFLEALLLALPVDVEVVELVDDFLHDPE